MSSMTDPGRLLRHADIDVLRDPTGTSYQPADLPCSSERHDPAMWDSAADRKQRAQARRLCCSCPGLSACFQRRVHLIETRQDVSGTWAAQYTRPSDEQPGNDPVIERWAAEMGIVLHTPSEQEEG